MSKLGIIGALLMLTGLALFLPVVIAGFFVGLRIFSVMLAADSVVMSVGSLLFSLYMRHKS